MPNAPLFRIGYAAATKRKLKTDGARFDQYFVGSYQGKRTLVNPNPSTYDTIAEVAKAASECAYQVKPLATKVLMRSTIEETLRMNWQFCYDYIDYIEDNDEEVREPLAAWAQKRADCDCYATFLSSLLICQNIVHYSDTVKMYNKSNFQHIFIIVPKNPSTFNPELDKNDKSKYWTLDPVVDSFNHEPEKITFKHLTKMGAALYRISGIGNTVNTTKPSTLTFGNEFTGYGSSLIQNKDYIQGLGCTANKSFAQAQLLHDEFLQRLKVSLINTRNRLSATNFQGKQAILENYDKVISVWDDETLRKQEYQKIEGTLGSWLSDQKKALEDNAKRQRDKIADDAKRALEEAQRAADEVAKKIKEGAASVKSKAEQFADFLKKINPIGIAGRETIFNVFRNNTGGAASRMKWAYASDEIFVLNGQPLANKQKYKDKLSDVQKIVKAMGGTEMELQSAVQAGDSLPQKPVVGFAIPVSDAEKKEILDAMAGVLKGEAAQTEIATVVAVNTNSNTNTNAVTINNAGAGFDVVKTNIATNVLRVNATDPYYRPLTAQISPLVSNNGIYTVSNVTPTNNSPVYSVSIGGLSGVDDAVKDILGKIWDFIKELGDDIGQFCKDFGDKLVQFIKVSALALPRAFFLLLMKLNVDGIATAINLNSERFENAWVKNFGGERTAFKNVLADGAKKDPFKIKLLKPFASYLTKQASIKGLGSDEELTPEEEAAKEKAYNENRDAIIKASADAIQAFAESKKEGSEIKATMITVCTLVGTAIGAACGGYGAVVGAPAGAACGALVAMLVGDPKTATPVETPPPYEPTKTTKNNNGTTTTTTTNTDGGTTTTTTNDADGKVVNTETKDKDGNVIPPPKPKKSNAFAWIATLAIGAKLLFASGALGGIEENEKTPDIKPDAPANDLSGTRIKSVTI